MEEKLFGHYRRDASGAYLIEISVPDVGRLFSPHDAMPFYERDLNRKITDSILEQLVVFPGHVPVRLVVHLPLSAKKRQVERKLTKAIRHHFEYDYLDSHLHLKRRIRKGRKTFLVAALIFVCLVSLATLIERFFAGNPFLSIFSQGLFVGGWVSLWHPLETLLYEWLPLHEEKKKFARLLAMDIRFVYRKR